MNTGSTMCAAWKMWLEREKGKIEDLPSLISHVDRARSWGGRCDPWAQSYRLK